MSWHFLRGMCGYKLKDESEKHLAHKPPSTELKIDYTNTMREYQTRWLKH